MESDTTSEKLDAILDALKKLETRVDQIEGRPTSAAPSARAAAKKISIREFLIDHPPTTDIQRTLVIGHFLETHAGMLSFTSADLEKGYRDAKETPPSNIRVNITHCIKDGHMMEADDKKDNKTAYVVTRRGEEFVAGGFPKTPKRGK